MTERHDHIALAQLNPTIGERSMAMLALLRDFAQAAASAQGADLVVAYRALHHRLSA